MENTLSFKFGNKQDYDEFIEAMASVHGYSSVTRDDKGATVKNVVDKEQFVKDSLIKLFKASISKHRSNKASQEAILLAKKSVESFEVK